MQGITIKNRNNHNLSAIFHQPKNKTNKIIIFTHSFKGDKDYQPIIREFASHICREGYAMIRFDCYGTGDSDGAFEDSSITTQVADLEDVIEYVKGQGYTSICLSGISLGTSVSIMAYDTSIQCMVFWSPVFEHTKTYEAYKEEILKKGFIIRKRGLTGEKVKIGKAMWEDFKNVKPPKKLQQITCPVLSIVGSDDHHITPDQAETYMKKIPSKNQLEIIQGGDHDFLKDQAKQKCIEISTKFVKQHL